MAKMKNVLFVLGLVCLPVIALLQAGCASAPPTAFEIAESLEGTAWLQGSLLVMNDRTSGVLTDREEKETAFTYTAVYDAQNRTFDGTITLEDGRVADFSVRNAGIFGWGLNARLLESSNFQYRTPEQLEEVYRQKRVKAEIVEKYGSEYRGLSDLMRGWSTSDFLKRDDENFYIAYDSTYGLHQTNPGSPTQIIRTAYKLHSKDGVTITLLGINTSSHQYADVEGVGTFNVHISDDTVTISNGTGAGTTFNGIYKKSK